METKSLRTKNLNKEEMEVIREVLKADKDRLVFHPEDPKDGLAVTIVWGTGKGKEGEDDSQDNQKQQGKDQGQGNRGQQGQQGQEAGEEEGESEGSEGHRGPGKKGGDSQRGNKDKHKQGDGEEGGEGEGGSREERQEGDSEGGSEEGGKEGEKQGHEGKKGGKGRERGEEGEGEPGGKEGGDKRGEEEGKSGEEGEEGDKKGGGEQEGEGKGKGQGKEKGEPDSSGGGDQGKSPDDMDIDDILGGGDPRNKSQDDDNDWENGDYEDDRKKGKDRDREKTRGKGKDDKGDKGNKGDKRQRSEDEDDQEMESETDYKEDFPPKGDKEPDPKILDVVFGKSRQVEEKENKRISRSFVFAANKEQIEVFKIEYKKPSGAGDRTYIKKLAKLVYHLYEPFLKASGVDLDPSEPVIPSPISPQGLRSPRSYERPMISYGAISRVDKVDFHSLIVFIDVSGSMDMRMVARAVNSYFYSVFSGLKKPGSQVVKVIVVLHGTNAGVFGVSASWRSAGNIIAKVAESSRDVVGGGNGSESTLTHRIIDILKTVNPLPGANISNFLWGQVPILWITDFLWSVSVSDQFTNFLKNKPALLLSTLADPGDGGGGDENVFEKLGQGTALTILRKVPYGALVFFPSFTGVSSGDFDPQESSSTMGSGARVYAKGQAYEQLVNSRGKIGQITVVRVR